MPIQVRQTDANGNDVVKSYAPGTKQLLGETVTPSNNPPQTPAEPQPATPGADPSTLNSQKWEGSTTPPPQSGELQIGKEPQPTDQQTNTGSGIESAIGTQYSWDKEGLDQAQKQYQQDALKAKQDALKNRQNIEQNAANYQQQADMMQYQNNQSADKVGWTGGYVLDQDRQMDYLKASIQAQMYGAMELQKYGYESGLAAARLSYDLNQKEFAHKYYMDAVSTALQEANQTGVYISAETKDMMSQLGVADDKLKQFTLENGEIDEEKLNNAVGPEAEAAKQAYGVQKQINSWFESNGISKAGVKTLQKIQYEEQLALQKQETKWARYEAAQKMFDQEQLNNPNMFIKVDANGNPIMNPETGLYETGSWDTMSGMDVLDYVQHRDADGNIIVDKDRAKQFTSYISTTLKGEVQAGFSNYVKEHSEEAKKEGGMEKLFNDYMKSNDKVASFLNEKFASIDQDSKAELYKSLDSISFYIETNGFTKEYNVKINEDGTIGNEFGYTAPGTEPEKEPEKEPKKEPATSGSPILGSDPEPIYRDLSTAEETTGAYAAHSSSTGREAISKQRKENEIAKDPDKFIRDTNIYSGSGREARAKLRRAGITSVLGKK